MLFVQNDLEQALVLVVQCFWEGVHGAARRKRDLIYENMVSVQILHIEDDNTAISYTKGDEKQVQLDHPRRDEEADGWRGNP